MSVTSFSPNPYNSRGTAIGACITAASNIYFGPLSWTGFGASLLGGQLLAHGSIFLGNFCSKCVRSVFSCSKLNKELEHWCNEKVGAPEYAYRIEAAKKIKECYTNNATRLDLSRNQLTSIPDTVGALQNLTHLYLNHNRLTSISDVIGALLNLISFDLSNNQLSSLPDSIGALQKLRHLNLSKNRLTSLPDVIGTLRNLAILNLSNNELTSLSDVISAFRKLRHLNLSKNRLTSIPDVIDALRNLAILNLSNNELTSLPDVIGSLRNLGILNLSKNRLTSLPDVIGSLRNLTSLDLSENRLTSLPDTIGDLQNLIQLHLSNNPINVLPLGMIDLPQVCRINLTACPLSVAVLTRIRNATETPGYNGPHFYYSIWERDAQIAQRSLGDLLTELYTICHKTKPDLDQLSEVSNLQAWLGRLSMIADFRSKSKTLARKVTEYLELANHDPVFREYFAQITEDAATTCGDRMALSVIHLGLAKRLATTGSQNIRELADLLIEGNWTVEQLEKYAREKVETQRFVDEIEVYLGYLIPQTDSFTPKQKKTIRSLKEQLNIPLDVEEMIYFQCSNLSFDELKNGYTTILEKRRSPHERNKFLVSNLYWREALQKIKPSQYDEAMKCDNPLDALDQITNLVMSSESDDQSKEQNI